MKGQPGRRVHLHRALSKLGWGSRGQAWAWIRAGEVRVDGRVVTDPLTWVDLDRQQITRGGEGPPPVARVTLALHKPPRLCHHAQRRARPAHRLRPVAARPALGLPRRPPRRRLGRAAHPHQRRPTRRAPHRPGASRPQDVSRHGQRRPVRGGAAPAARRHRSGGRPDAARPGCACCERGGRRSVIEMVLTEGRNRQIRRMWAALGRRVTRLVRVAIGGLELGDLPPGACRELGEAELALIHRFAKR